MLIMLVILVPLVALFIWAVMFDLKWRRRHAGLTSHDIVSAARTARGTPTLVAVAPAEVTAASPVSDKAR